MLKSIKLIKILIYFLLFSTILTINVIDDSYVFASNNIPKPDSTFKRWFKNLFCLPTKQISIPSNLEMTHAGNQAISRIKDQLNQAYSTTVIKQVMWDDKDIIQKESKNIKIDDEKSLMKEMFFEVKHSGEVNLEYPSIKIDNQNQDFDTNSQKSKKTSFEMNDAEDTCKTPNIKPSERYDTHNEDNNNIGLSDVRTNITEISASQNSIYSSANHPIFQNDSIVEDVNQVRNFNESHVRETADEKEQSVIVIEKPLDDAIVEENQHINQVENLMNFVPPPAEIIPAPEVEAIPRRERLDAAAHIELFVNLDNLQADRIVPPIIEAIEEERQFPPPILVNDQMLNLPNPLDIEHIINEPELPADQREEQLNIQERQEMIIEVPAVVEARHVVVDDAIVEENQHINQVENLMNFVPPPAEIIPAPEVEAIPRRERLDAAAHIELFVNNLQIEGAEEDIARILVIPVGEMIQNPLREAEEERQFLPPILVNDQMLNLQNPLDIARIDPIQPVVNEPELPADQREEQLNIQERQEMIIEVPAVVEARHVVVVDDAIVEENQHINQVENLMNFVPPPAEIIPAPVRELDDPFAESGYRLDEFFEVAMDPPPAEIIPVIEDLDDSYIEEEFVEKKEDNLITTTISENINSNKKNETNKISAEKYSQLNKDNISNNSAIDLAVKDKIILMIREELQGGLDNNYINLLTTQLNEIHNINKNITENLNNSIFEKYLLEHTLSAGDDNVAIQQNIWINYMYFTGRQKRTGKKDPYSVNSYGIIGGIELVNDKDMMIGMSYGNMFSKIKYPPNKNTASLINSHIFMLYHNSHMFYKPKSKYCYIQSIATIAFNNVKSKFIRKILNNDEEFKVSLKSVDYNFATKFNYNVPIKNFSIIPNIGISYGSNMLNNYNEIGFGNINSINVTYSPINLININIGVNIIGEKILYRGFNILPKLQLSVSQNLNSKDYNLKTTAIVLGETKKYDVLIPKDNKNTYNIGTSIAVNKSKNIKLELMYNYSFDNNKYNSHQFAFKMHLGF